MPPPPPSNHPAFRLNLLHATFAVTQVRADEPVPTIYLEALVNTRPEKFISITRTKGETSIVYESEPDDENAAWRCIKIAGPMDFGVTGVMCNFSTPLKMAEIPIFAVSTWNTDYILVPKDLIAKAVSALNADGWQFEE